MRTRHYGEVSREWLKEHPGFVGGYHAQDSKTGRMVSITVWDTEESMRA